MIRYRSTMFRLICALTILAGTTCLTGPACARSPDDNSMQGTWIWDPDLFIPWPDMPQDPRLVAETMSVTRDDGTRYTAHNEMRYSDGQINVIDEDMAEDGADHPVQTSFGQIMNRISVQPDGGRHMVVSSPGNLHIEVCYLLDGGMTLSCDGTHRSADGTVGRVRCVYHRDPHVIPVSQLALRRAIG